MFIFLLVQQAIAAPIAVDLRCPGLDWGIHELRVVDATGARVAQERVPSGKEVTLFLRLDQQAARLELAGPVCAWEADLDVEALRAGAFGAEGQEWAWMADGTGGPGPLPGRCEEALAEHRGALEAFEALPLDLWVCLEQPELAASVAAWWPELAASLGPWEDRPRDLYQAYLVAGLPRPEARERVHALRIRRHGSSAVGVAPHIDQSGQRYLTVACEGTAERAAVDRVAHALFLTPAQGHYQVVPVEPALLEGVELILCQGSRTREVWVDHGLRKQHQDELERHPRKRPTMPVADDQVGRHQAEAAQADPLVALTHARMLAGETVADDVLEEAVRRGLAHRDTRALALQLAHRLPCGRTLPLFAGRNDLTLPAAVARCAESSVDGWLEVAGWQLAGGFPGDVLPRPPAVTDEVRAAASRLLLAAWGAWRWKQQRRATERILRSEHVAGSLVLHPGATPYAQVLSVSARWGCANSDQAEIIDGVMVMPWTGTAPEHDVLWLTQDQAQVRGILCGTRFRVPPGRG